MTTPPEITFNTLLSDIILGNNHSVFDIESKCAALGFQADRLGGLIECVKAFGLEREFARNNSECYFALATDDPFDKYGIDTDRFGKDDPVRFTSFRGLGGKNSTRIKDAFDAVGFNWRAYIGPQKKEIAKGDDLVTAIRDLTDAISKLIAAIKDAPQ